MSVPLKSSLEDVDKWRLRTKGGIPYRFLNATGAFDQDNGEATWELLIEAADLLDFLDEMLDYGGVDMPGVPSMSASSIDFSPWDSDLPLDAFNHDPNAPKGTYQKIIKVNLKFNTGETAEGEDPQPEDEFDFLDISSEGNGEFLTIPPSGKMKAIDGGAPSEFTPPEDRDSYFVKDVTPVTKMIPLINWSVTWKSIPYAFFRDVQIGRLRFNLGMINATYIDFLFDAPPETILFMGWSMSQTKTWKISSGVRQKAVSLTMNFVERRISLDDGETGGHNHHYVPGEGWKTVLSGDPAKPTYAPSYIMNDMVSKVPTQVE